MNKVIPLVLISVLAAACEGRPVGECPDWATPQAHEHVVADICDGKSDKDGNAVMRFAAEVTSHTGVIVVPGGMGNGVAVEGGRVLTALHVVMDKATGESRGDIWFQAREMDAETGAPIGCHVPIEMAVEATANQAGVEVAVLVPAREGDENLLPEPIAVAARTVTKGDIVWQFGQRSRWAEGTVTADGRHGYVSVDMAGQPGDSGGALVDADGRLVGLVAYGNQDAGYVQASSVEIMREIGLI